MISRGRPTSITLPEVLEAVSEVDILAHYLNVTSIPCVIASPLRQDKKPSFGLYSLDGKSIYYKDFATQETGGTFQLLKKMWGLSFQETLDKVYSDMIEHRKGISVSTLSPSPVKIVSNTNHTSTLECKIREWRDYDIQYWESYGVTLPWLKYAEVYPISHKIINKDGQKYIFQADKYAYAFVEHKEGKVTLKIYQPFNKDGYKWSNKHDRSVVSLWTKIPKTGDKVCICSSLKDALCLSCNLGIPAIAIQGEAYGLSETATKELRRRFREVFICLDSDKWGIADAERLAERTGFTNIVLPAIDGAKDISDIFKVLGKERFINTLKPLFYDTR